MQTHADTHLQEVSNYSLQKCQMSDSVQREILYVVDLNFSLCLIISFCLLILNHYYYYYKKQKQKKMTHLLVNSCFGIHRTINYSRSLASFLLQHPETVQIS